MQIAVIGTGYVGLVTGTCLAELGNQVTCLDINTVKIKQLQKGISPIYEPGLDELIGRNLKVGRLHFTTQASEAIPMSEVIFIAVGTPSREDGGVEMGYVEAAAQEIGKRIKHYAVVVNKSTVPIGTGDHVTEIIARHYRGAFDVVSNPEFLREGQAVRDFMEPDRIVIGNASPRAHKIMEALYRPVSNTILFTDVKTAEMIKYASNSFLATSISFINNLAELCEKVGADVTKVAAGMRLDGRIGPHAFLTAGPGYGGSCFPKDVKGLIKIAHGQGTHLPILEATEEINHAQRARVLGKVKKLVGDLKGKTIAVWGLAFKANTDDLRESPAVELVKNLLSEGSRVRCFDPVAEKNGRLELPDVDFTPSAIAALSGAACLVVMTEWDEFREVDLKSICRKLKNPNLIDARNLYDRHAAQAAGLRYEGMGR